MSNRLERASKRDGAGSVDMLLVSSSVQVMKDVEAALAQRSVDAQLIWVSEPGKVLSRAAECSPQVIIVDEMPGEFGAVDLIKRLRKQIPRAPVLALLPRGATDLASKAVLAGASGFATKPLDATDLSLTLEQLLGSHRLEPVGAPATVDGRVVVFCAPKGGTGRTTLALNTALSLMIETKTPTVMVDADYAAPALDVALNLDRGRTIDDILPRIACLDDDLLRGVLASHASGLHVLLAPTPEDKSKHIAISDTDAILGQLQRMYAWTIVDLGLPLNETAFGFLEVADLVVVTVLPEMIGLRNTRLLLDKLQDRGVGDEHIWLVLNSATIRGGVSQADIERRLRLQVRHRIPADQPLVTHAVNRGVPLVLSHRRSAVGRAIRRLAREMVDVL